MSKKYVTLILAAVLGIITGCGSPIAGTAAESTVAAAADDSSERMAESGTYVSAESEPGDHSAAESSADTRIASAKEMVDAEDVIEDWMVPVTAESLKDGTYPVTVVSSSSMFKIESAELLVRDGKMEAVLVMGGTGYLHVFMGRPDQAVAADEADYISYEENEDGAHTFTIPVEALDYGIDCAAFSKRKEKWYERTLVVRADSLPATAWREEALTTANDLGLSDGTYTVDVSLSGGSGRASVQSPAEIRIEGDSAIATVVWNSSKYDYMIVDGRKYEPVSVENGSAFEIPIPYFDRPIRVVGDTTAMSKPYEIEYVLVFNSETVK